MRVQTSAAAMENIIKVPQKKIAKHMVMEDDSSLGGGHTVKYTVVYHRNIHLEPI